MRHAGIPKQSSGVVEVLHDPIRSMIAPTVVCFVEDKQSNVLHPDEGVGKCIAENVMGADDDAYVQQRLVPHTLRAPEVAAILTCQQLR